MPHKFSTSLLTLAMVLGLASPTAMAVDTQEAPIVILHTNDTHCDIENDHGFAGVASYKALMETEGNYVTLVDAGDFVQGDAIGALTDGEAIIEIMNQVGYDIVTLGNHEFDYQVPQMFYLMEQLESDVVSCNFVDTATGASVFDPYVIYSYGDVDVAYVGITTPETFTKATPSYFMDENGDFIYGFCQGNNGQDLYDTVQTAIDEALADGADYVIGIAHLGIEETAAPWRSTDVIANTTGMDVLIDGHSHTEAAGEEVANLDGDMVLMSQTGEKFNNIGKITITDDGITAELVSVEDYTEKDATVQTVIDDINADFETLLNSVVATSDVALIATDLATGAEIVRSQETNLGDLVADAYRTVLDADVAIINGGGIRADIAAGDITYADIIAVNPWGNNATSVRVTGQVLLDTLELGAISAPEVNPAFMQVSGMTYTIDTTIPSSVVTDDKGSFLRVDGDYRVTDVMIGGQPLDLEAYYTVGSHDYMLLSFGDGMTMFEGAEVVKDRVMVDNELLIAYVEDMLGGVVGDAYAHPNGQGRITILTEAADTTAASRGDVIASLWQDAGAPTAQIANPFSDVSPDDADYEAIVWAAAQGITIGYGDGTFRPDALCTDTQLDAFFSRYDAMGAALYAQADSWAYWAEGDGDADCFFIAPTVYSTTEELYLMSMDDEATKANFLGATNMEKGIYDQNCTFYAPYYTQVSIEVYELEQAQQDAYLEQAYQSVRDAFVYYMDTANDGRPIVLAGFSQGADLCMRLVEEFFDAEGYQDQLVACYAIGWGITQEEVDETPHLQLAQGADDTGVMITFNTEADGMDTSLMVPTTTLGINPLNWCTDSTYGDATLNLGACFTDYDGAIVSELPALTGAYLDAERGTLIVDDTITPEDYPPVLSIFADGIYHLYDYQFFYRNLQQNVTTRLDAFVGK
ncbi:DUF3089 domain-containing protein [Bengtsoniella intestinalis]|uniref:DUF3089 domain-containing protein n=1 Tax=Bengtsoniella intestinalis TaxID=3073143 RepID=UPI00391F5846